MALEVAGFVGTVDQIQFANLMRFVTYSGVEDLQLTPVLDADRTVRVAFSRAAVPGVTIKQTTPMNVALPVNPSATNSRRDRIILRYDWHANNGLGQATLTSKQGTPAQNPSWPPLEADAGRLWEQSLGRVTVGPGQGVLAPGNIIASGIPRNSPVITLDDETGLPFAHSRALVIDPGTGRVRASDGSSYHEILPGGDTPWQSQTVTDAWKVRGNGVIWRSRRNGIVHLRGALHRGAVGSVWNSDSHMFTLPAAWRPSQSVYGFCTQVFGEQRWFRLTVNSSDGQGIVRVAGDEQIRDTQMFFSISFPQF